MAGSDANGESWCGHELLNTVTTDWVEDHLGDPEVCNSVVGARHGTVNFRVRILSPTTVYVNM